MELVDDGFQEMASKDRPRRFTVHGDMLARIGHPAAAAAAAAAAAGRIRTCSDPVTVVTTSHHTTIRSKFNKNNNNKTRFIFPAG